MERSIQELSQLREWRKRRNIEVEREPYVPQNTHETQVSQYHFIHYDPIMNPDIANIKFNKKKNNNSANKAIFSIPIDFTKETRTTYKRHDKAELGFDVRLFLTKNNAPCFPMRK